MILGQCRGPSPPASYGGVDLKDRLASLPEGVRIYAIGDIHGQLGLLQRIHEQIDEVEQRNPARDVVEITLGDQIDRGWNSRGVIDCLIERSRTRRLHVLQGNHERMLLRALEDPSQLPFWLRFGGVETVL